MPNIALGQPGYVFALRGESHAVEASIRACHFCNVDVDDGHGHQQSVGRSHSLNAIFEAPSITSCDSPPDNADATTANRNAFIQTWMSRISDKAWFANFAKQGTLPDGVANDPYYSMGKDTQAWLVSCLVDNMLASAS